MKTPLQVFAAIVTGLALGAAAQGTKIVSGADARFLQKAAADGLAEVELGQIGTDKAMRDEVKQFATRMVADHRKANEDLMELAASKGVQLPTEVDAKHRKVLDKLRGLSGPDFDRA